MRTDEGDKIHALVRQHVGKHQAISSLDLCRQLNWPLKRERLVRQIISDEGHLWPNILVCSIPGRGFFCAETYEEAEAHDNWLSDLIKTARDKQTSFRTACRKMGFNFARPLSERRAA